MGLRESDALVGPDRSWLAMGGAMTKALLGGEWFGRSPTDRGKLGAKRNLVVAKEIPLGLTVEGANRNDKKLVEMALENIPADTAELEAGPSARFQLLPSGMATAD